MKQRLKQRLKKHLNLISTLVATLFFLACATTPEPVQTPATFEPIEAAPVEPPKPTLLKRTIRDEDLRRGNEDGSPKKRVVVLPFLDRDTNRSQTVLKNAHEAFLNDLNKTQNLIAIDSSEIKLDLTKYVNNSEYNLPALVKDTQSAGVSSLLECKVIDVRFRNNIEDPVSMRQPRRASFEIVVQAKLISVRSGQMLFNTVKTVTLEEENTQLPENVTSDIFFGKNPELVELLIKDAFMDFTLKLGDALNQVIWEGRIATLQGDKLYLNVGQVSGVHVGDILKVVEDGNEVYDPELGYHIGKVPGKIKGTIEVVSFFGQDGAVGIIHSGAGFKENDRIELYE
jgi:hypothetical protein